VEAVTIVLHIERSHEQGALLAGPPAEVDAIAATAGLTSRDACDGRIRVIELRDAPGVRAEETLRAAVALAERPPAGESCTLCAAARRRCPVHGPRRG
jgi:hypothetical protein